ncbi:hypothetical protein K7X08_021610 [Anisodus acutangulus]|uniref:VQ domain-containing protein n=1 Tax=Anisodus acutangulus TaxID=402998 RepID=A0A9Q1M4L5_9SOLA|nr:hypothetical protein K7X08_021610 [Anisodus acutangulus]
MQDSKMSTKKKVEPMKVKYISSPVMVNVKNPSEFRATVQQLTGKSPPKSSNIYNQHAKIGNYYEGVAANKACEGSSNFVEQLMGNEGHDNFWKQDTKGFS